MRRFITAGVVAVTFLTSSGSVKAEIIAIDFNELLVPFPRTDGGVANPADYVHGYLSYEFGGLTLSNPTAFIELMQSSFANHDFEANFASVPLNGTGIMRPAGESGQFEMTAGHGGMFRVNSMELLMGFDGGEMGAAFVTFEGFRGGMSVGSLGVDLRWNTVPGAPAGSGFGWTAADLRSLGSVDRLVIAGRPTTSAPPGSTVPAAHFQNSAEFWVDNILVHRVPEPSTLLLMAIGAACAMRLRKTRH